MNKSENLIGKGIVTGLILKELILPGISNAQNSVKDLIRTLQVATGINKVAERDPAEGFDVYPNKGKDCDLNGIVDIVDAVCIAKNI